MEEKKQSIPDRRKSSMLGKKHSEETKRKMSENHWSKKPNYINPFKGKKIWGKEGLLKRPHPRGTLGKNHTEEWKKNYGLKIKELWKTKEFREKIISSLKGKKKPPRTEEHRRNLSKSLKGRRLSPSTEFKKGFKHTQEFKEYLSKISSAENHWNWQGGISKEPYDKLFNNKFKNLIRKRDNQICMLCGIHREKLKRALDVHHINYDKKLTIPENYISLCESCHIKTNYNRKYWIPFFQNLLTEKYKYNYSENKIVVEIQNG